MSTWASSMSTSTPPARNNGSSWTDAFTDLQDGIDLAVSGIEVWVAEGTYVPGSSRADSFVPKNGVRVFGGFAGGETDPAAARLDSPTRPSSAARSAAPPPPTTATTSSAPRPRIRPRCSTVSPSPGVTPTAAATDDQGGGVRARGGGVTLANVTLVDNYATTGGGVMVNLGGTVKAYNCSFVNNQAPGFEGGGFYGSVASAQPLTLVNCVFTGNSAWRGGGIALDECRPAAGAGQPEPVRKLGRPARAAESTSTPRVQFTIHNSILWGNTGPNPQISAYAGVGWPDRQLQHRPGRMDPRRHPHPRPTNPSFADAELRINLDSPAIDSGDSTAVPAGSRRHRRGPLGRRR